MGEYSLTLAQRWPLTIAKQNWTRTVLKNREAGAPIER